MAYLLHDNVVDALLHKLILANGWRGGFRVHHLFQFPLLNAETIAHRLPRQRLVLVQLRLVMILKGLNSCDLLVLFERAVIRVVLADHWTSKRVRWQVLRILQIILCRDEGCVLKRWLGMHIASIIWQK